MTEPILEPSYWKERIEKAQETHHSVFLCGINRWNNICKEHRAILHRTIGPSDSVLDAGCAYGRLLDLMPRAWHGDYHGIDLSPDFIEKAKRSYPEREFTVGDLRDLSRFSDKQFKWGILVSIRPMVKRNLGNDEWSKMESELTRVCENLLYLEYDEESPIN